MMRQILPLLVLLDVAPACQPPRGGPGAGDEAIEITGYLDTSRISWTHYGDRSQVAGQQGATTPEATVVLANLHTEARIEATASVLGAFVLSIPAAAGDHLELWAEEAPEDELVEHDVVTDRPPFPEPLSAHATLGPHHDVAVVELSFEPPLEGGHVWVVNPNTDAAASVLNAFDHGTIHGGEIRGSVGDQLLLYWVPMDGPESLPLELEITRSDRP